MKNGIERPLDVAGEAVYSLRVLPAFYESRVYAPAWSRDGAPIAAARELADRIRSADIEGLDPAAYHLEAISRLLGRRAPTAAELAELDLLLTDAFLILGAHLVSGRVDPETFDPEWFAYRREVDLVEALTRALGATGPARVLDGLLPAHGGYFRLRDALARYRALADAGGWPTVGQGPTLRPGDSDPRVVRLRDRLNVTDPEVEAPRATSSDELYDSRLEQRVRAFQRRHGLDDDGAVGAKTQAALDVPAAERVRAIELNLERWRWLPRELGDRYVLVNIPGCYVVVIDDGRAVLSMRAAVGRRLRRTPVFSDAIRYFVLNPYWEVPHSLAVRDKLPEIQKDPSYLDRQGFRVYQGWGSDQVSVDPASVDWAGVTAGSFRYRLRQSPGPLNALGRIKFMFPNRFNIYLHDTPERRVFDRAERDVSSGCIRLERPIDLAVELMGPQSKWDRQALEAALETGAEKVLTLERPVPVHLLYWTAWVDTEGTMHFRRDIYERDPLLDRALRETARGTPTP